MCENNNVVKSCMTCDRRFGTTMFGMCNYSGHYCSSERANTSVCGRDYEKGWIKRRPFLYRLFGINKENN